MTRFSFMCIGVVLFAVGCQPQEQIPKIDLEAERSGLLAADAAWSETAGDAEKFVSYFAEGGRFLPPGQPLQEGKDAILEVATGLMSLPGLELQWGATSAEVSASGDLGYTVGTYEMSVNDAEGNPQTTIGKYLTAWKKQPDGQWKVVADCFNEDAPPGSQQ